MSGFLIQHSADSIIHCFAESDIKITITFPECDKLTNNPIPQLTVKGTSVRVFNDRVNVNDHWPPLSRYYNLAIFQSDPRASITSVDSNIYAI